MSFTDSSLYQIDFQEWLSLFDMAENRVLFISSRLEDFGRQSWKCFDRLLPKIDWHRYANAPWWALISLSGSVLYCCIYLSFLFDMYLYSGGDLYRQSQMPDRLYRYVCCVCVCVIGSTVGRYGVGFCLLKFSLLLHAEWIYPPLVFGSRLLIDTQIRPRFLFAIHRDCCCSWSDFHDESSSFVLYRIRSFRFPVVRCLLPTIPAEMKGIRKIFIFPKYFFLPLSLSLLSYLHKLLSGMERIRKR